MNNRIRQQTGKGAIFQLIGLVALYLLLPINRVQADDSFSVNLEPPAGAASCVQGSSIHHIIFNPDNSTPPSPPQLVQYTTSPVTVSWQHFNDGYNEPAYIYYLWSPTALTLPPSGTYNTVTDPNDPTQSSILSGLGTWKLMLNNPSVGQSCVPGSSTTTISDAQTNFNDNGPNYYLYVFAYSEGHNGPTPYAGITIESYYFAGNGLPPTITVAPSSGTFSISATPTINLTMNDTTLITSYNYSLTGPTSCGTTSGSGPVQNQYSQNYTFGVPFPLTCLPPEADDAGTYTLNVSATDLAGNTTSYISTYTLVDITPTSFTGVAISTKTIQYSWTAPAYQPAFYEFLENGIQLGPAIPGTSTTVPVDFSVLPVSFTPNFFSSATLQSCFSNNDPSCGTSALSNVDVHYTWADPPQSPSVSARSATTATFQWGNGNNPLPPPPGTSPPPIGTYYSVVYTNLYTNQTTTAPPASVAPQTIGSDPSTALTPNTSYTYTIDAQNGDIPPHLTPFIASSPLTFWTLPAAPTGLAVTAQTITSISASFAFPTGPANPAATQYVIQVIDPSNNVISSPLIPQGTGTASATISGLTGGIQYSLQACAISLSGSSADNACSSPLVAFTPSGFVNVTSYNAILSNATVGISLDNVLYGVPGAASVQAIFNVPIDPTSLAVTITRVSGSVAIPFSAFSVNYSSASGTPTATITPSSGWTTNTVYRVTLSSGVTDLWGYQSTAPSSIFFVTVPPLDPNNSTASSSVISPLDTTLSATLSVPENSIPVGGFVAPRVQFISPASPVSGAPASALSIKEQGIIQTFLTAEVDVYTSACVPGNQACVPGNPNSPLTLKMVAPGASVGSLSHFDPSTIGIYQYSQQGRLMLVPGSKLNSDGSVSAQITQSGLYFLAGAVTTQLSGAYAWPVPYRPSLGHTVIHFVNLATASTIKVYTIMGELVAQLESDALGSDLTWDVRNKDGDNVASGVYIYQIKNSFSEKRGKLIIIR